MQDFLRKSEKDGDNVDCEPGNTEEYREGFILL